MRLKGRADGVGWQALRAVGSGSCGRCEFRNRSKVEWDPRKAAREQQRQKVIDYLSQQRWVDAEKGSYAVGPHEISPRPVLLIAGENAHSRYYSADVYKTASEPKQLLIVPSADHVDLYDRMD